MKPEARLRRPIVFALLALFVLAAWLPAPLAARAEGDIFPFETRRVDLDNGMRAYLIHAGAPHQVAYVTMVRTGSRDEVEPGKTGFAHFFEHMMFRGTKKYPNYDAASESMGAQRNAFTSTDMTVFYLVAANKYLDQIVDLESDRFQNLAYSEDGFRTEAGAVLGEYQNNAYSPFAVLERELRLTAFQRHTYRHETIGFEADVRAMPQGFEYSKSFYQRFYRPDNVVVVVAGDFDFDHAESVLHEHYDAWKPGYQAPDIPVEPEQEAPRRKTVEYSGRTLPLLAITFKAPAWSATDRLAVATEVLGNVAFGPNSEIYRRLVIEEQRVQALTPSFGLERDPGLVAIDTMVSDPTDTDAVRDAILEAVAKSRDQLVDAKLLEDTKSHMRYSYLMGLETARGVAFSLIQPVIDTGGIEAINDYYRTLATITPEDVREAARRYLVEKHRTLVTLVEGADS